MSEFLETRFDPRQHDDLFALSARAQRLTRALHGRSDVVVSLRSDLFVDPEHPDETGATHLAPGHFEESRGVLTVNLDDVCEFEHPSNPERFPRLADFNSPDRLYESHPVMMGVMAHELAHARWSLNKPVVPGFSFMSDAERRKPENLPSIFRRVLEITVERNPDARVRPEHLDDASDIQRFARAFGVASTIVDLFDDLEEPRIERLVQDGGPRMVFSKHWRLAVQASAGKLVLDGLSELADRGNQTVVTQAVSGLILVYGRVASGVLSPTDSLVEQIIENCVATIDEHKPVDTKADPEAELTSEAVMRIIRRAVFCDEHVDPTPLIECAFDILDAIRVEPPEPDEPESGQGGESESGQGDADGKSGDGESESGQGGDGESGQGDADGESGDGEPESGQGGEGDADGKSGDGDPTAGLGEPDSGEFLETLTDDAGKLRAALGERIPPARKVEVERRDSANTDEWVGHGSVLFANPNAPTVFESVPPTADDTALYRSARSWLERMVSPTVTEHARAGWLPMADAEFDVDQYVYDELAGNVGDERGEWRRREWAVKPAPPVKIGIMLDCSGSMSQHARAAAAAAWALQSAASDIAGSEVCSVAYGDEAGLTLTPGRIPPRTVDVMATNHGTENWLSASRLLESQLRLDDAIANDLADPTGESRTNALIIIVSDLMYGGTEQAVAVNTDLARWREAGFRVVLVGPMSADAARGVFDEKHAITDGSYIGYAGWIDIGDSDLVRRALDGVDWVEGTKSADMAREFDRL